MTAQQNNAGSIFGVLIIAHGKLAGRAREALGSPELKERTKENARARARMYVRARVAISVPVS